MSRMSDIVLTIQEYLMDGEYTNVQIAEMLNVPVRWVNSIAEEMESNYDDSYDDSMDGDHQSALASVGWGTDEDYVAENDYFDSEF